MFELTRKKAKIKGDIFYFTGVICKNGHLSKRYTSCAVCFDCKKDFRILHPEKELNRIYKHNKKRPDLQKIRGLKYRATYKGKSSNNATRAKQRADLLNRTPSWLTNDDKKIIKDMYTISSRVSKETGIKHHVDHIIPLRGELVSGLHVPNNLQLLTAFNNIAKSNNYV